MRARRVFPAITTPSNVKSWVDDWDGGGGGGSALRFDVSAIRCRAFVRSMKVSCSEAAEAGEAGSMLADTATSGHRTARRIERPRIIMGSSAVPSFEVIEFYRIARITP